MEIASVRWPRLSLRASIGIAAGLVAFVATAALALTRDGGAGSAPPRLRPERPLIAPEQITFPRGLHRNCR